MKKNLLSAITLAGGILLTASLASCSGNKTTEKGGTLDLTKQIEAAYKPMVTDTVESVKYTLNGKETPATLIQKSFKGDSAEIYFTTVTGTIDSYPATNAYVAGKLRELYGYVTDTTPVSGEVTSSAQLDGAIQALGAQFMQEVVPVYQESVMPVFNLTANLQPAWADNAVVTYSVFDNYFTGGAHGMSDFYYETIDPATGNVIDFEHLIKADKASAFREQLVNTIAESKNMSVAEYLKSVNDYLMPEKGQEVTVDNFPVFHIGLIAEGLAVVYPPYSIAPYADGQPAFIIPAADYVAL